MYTAYTTKRSSMSDEEIEAINRFIADSSVFIFKCIQTGILHVTHRSEYPSSSVASVSSLSNTHAAMSESSLSATDEGCSETSDVISERTATSRVAIAFCSHADEHQLLLLLFSRVSFD